MALRANGRKGTAAALLLLCATFATLMLYIHKAEAYRYLEGALIETMDLKPFVSNDREAIVCYEADVVYYGHTLEDKYFQADYPFECQRACSREDLCHYWSWDSITKTCHLKDKDAVSARERSRKSQGFISGPKNCTMPFPMRCYELGAGFEGHTIIEQQGIESAFNCHQECLKQADCMYWTWKGDARTCSLKDIGALETWYKNSLTQTYVSGFRACGPCVELGVDYRGHDVQRIHGSTILVAEECRRLCMRKPGCFFWTWVRNDKNCYLKGLEALNGRLEDELTVGMVSGSKFCPLDRELRMMLMNSVPWASRDFFRHAKAPCYEEGVDYMNETVTEISSIDCAHDCHKECRNSELCYFWSYHAQTRDCFLKNAKADRFKRRSDATLYVTSGSKDCPCPDEEDRFDEL